jgi:nucleoporin NDC1
MRLSSSHESDAINARANLNERPSYYQSMFFFLALIQSVWHLYLDLDRVVFPIAKTDVALEASPPFLSPTSVGRLALWSLCKPIVAISVAIVVGTFRYWFLYGTFLWEMNFNVWDHTYSFSKSADELGWIEIWALWADFYVAGAFLCLLWDFTNAVFSHYITMAPLKKGVPITDDSKDPNGSLISGLKDKQLFRQVC